MLKHLMQHSLENYVGESVFPSLEHVGTLSKLFQGDPAELKKSHKELKALLDETNSSHNPHSEEEIAELEKNLGAKISSDLHRFLRTIGSIDNSVVQVFNPKEMVRKYQILSKDDSWWGKKVPFLSFRVTTIRGEANAGLVRLVFFYSLDTHKLGLVVLQDEDADLKAIDKFLGNVRAMMLATGSDITSTVKWTLLMVGQGKM